MVKQNNIKHIAQNLKQNKVNINKSNKTTRIYRKNIKLMN